MTTLTDAERNDHLTGKYRTWVMRIRHLSPVTRYFLYMVPVALLLGIPIGVAFMRDESGHRTSPKHTLAGIEEKTFWVLVEAVWIGLWICTAVAHMLPKLVRKCTETRCTGERWHARLLDRLRSLIALILWNLLAQGSFEIVCLDGYGGACADKPPVH